MNAFASCVKQHRQDSDSVSIRSIHCICLGLFLGLFLIIGSPREASAIPVYSVDVATVGCPFCVGGIFNIGYNGTIFGFSGAQSIETSNATGLPALDGNILYTNSLVCCSFPIDTGLLSNSGGTVLGDLFVSIGTVSTDMFTIHFLENRYSVGASPPVIHSQSFTTQPISVSVPELNTIGLLLLGLLVVISYQWQQRRRERAGLTPPAPLIR